MEACWWSDGWNNGIGPDESMLLLITPLVDVSSLCSRGIDYFVHLFSLCILMLLLLSRAPSRSSSACSGFPSALS